MGWEARATEPPSTIFFLTTDSSPGWLGLFVFGTSQHRGQWPRPSIPMFREELPMASDPEHFQMGPPETPLWSRCDRRPVGLDAR